MMIASIGVSEKVRNPVQVANLPHALPEAALRLKWFIINILLSNLKQVHCEVVPTSIFALKDLFSES